MSKGILVIGGSGATGKHILQALAALLPDAPVSSASRHAGEGEAGAPPGISWDATAPDAQEALREYELVISCLGPSSRFKALAQRLCLKAGVDCVDVNDDFAAAGEIWALGQEAARAGVRLHTCMGMNPGLSTLLLFMLRESLLGADNNDGLMQGSVCVLSGADEDAGMASTQTMLDCLGKDSSVLREGRATRVAANDSDEAAFVRFPSHGERLFTAQCSSAEPALLQHTADYVSLWGGAPERPPAENIDYRMHFQGMPRPMAGWLRKDILTGTERRKKRLARFFFKMHHASRHKAGNINRSILSVFGRSDRQGGVLTATGSTVFGMTAAFAATVARLHLEHKDAIPAGVHFAHPRWLRPAEVLPLLGQMGVGVYYAEC